MDIRDLLEEIEVRYRLEANTPDIFTHSFQQQRDFISHPSKLKALFCTRRSAKSYTAGLYLVHEAVTNPGCNCLFIGLTRDTAKAIIWKDILHDINRRFNLGMTPNKSELSMTLPNGSVIKITGVDADEEEMKKLLGGKYRLVCIDEASMYTVDVRNLVYGVLKPATADPNRRGERGTICLMGTASNFPQGLFYDVTTGSEKGWQLFEWTAHDNPYVAKQWQEELDEIAKDRPLYRDTPQFKQWYLNQWVIDEEKLVYRFSPQRNLVKQIPKLSHDGWTYVLGVDTGWEDDNAFVLTGYHVNDPNLYIFKVFKRKRLTFDQVVEIINEFMKDPIYAPHKVFIDGANKQGVESMRSRSAIPFQYADKQDKVTFIELCNGDLVQGKILVHDIPINRPLWDEMSSLVWLTEGDKIKLPKKEHPNLANHLCFVAGTKVRAEKGLLPIEILNVGDYIETRKGLRRIVSTMNRDAAVVKLLLSNGSEIVCTPDHPFWVNNKWIMAQDLNPSNGLLDWTTHLRERRGLNGAERSIGGTKRNISAGKTLSLNRSVSIYIARFGQLISGISRTAITSIIKMKIQPITISPTWRVLKPKTILKFTQEQDSQARWIKPDHLPQFGTNLKRDARGTESTGKRPSPLSPPNAHGVGLNTKNRICIKTTSDAAPKNASQLSVAQAAWIIFRRIARTAKEALRLINTASKSHAPSHVLSITAIPEKRAVFNITVEGEHEYFAEDILVSNCDAFLYAWRNGYHYHATPAEKKIAVGSREWYLKQSEDIWEKEKERLLQESQKDLWPSEPDFTISDVFGRN